MTLGINIRKVRKALGLTQIEFAEQMHVSQAAISMWEKGKDRPTAAVLFRLADMTGDKSFITRETLTGNCEPSLPTELMKITRPSEEVLSELVAVRRCLEEANRRMMELLTEYRAKRRRK